MPASICLKCSKSCLFATFAIDYSSGCYTVDVSSWRRSADAPCNIFCMSGVHFFKNCYESSVFGASGWISFASWRMFSSPMISPSVSCSLFFSFWVFLMVANSLKVRFLKRLRVDLIVTKFFIIVLASMFFTINF